MREENTLGFQFSQSTKDFKRQSEDWGIGDYIQDFMLVLGYLFFLLSVLTMNFLALSISLNYNKDATFPVKMASGLFSFFFGIIYLIVNFYMFRLSSDMKPIAFDQDRLFPF
tara:strand:- start:1168 stop:1503 length:336 start_codon:yes stop_codon:yes gene_type:complete